MVRIRLLQPCRLRVDPRKIEPPGTIVSVEPEEAKTLVHFKMAELVESPQAQQLSLAIDAPYEKRERQRQWV